MSLVKHTLEDVLRELNIDINSMTTQEWEVAKAMYFYFTGEEVGEFKWEQK